MKWYKTLSINAASLQTRYNRSIQHQQTGEIARSSMQSYFFPPAADKSCVSRHSEMSSSLIQNTLTLSVTVAPPLRLSLGQRNIAADRRHYVGQVTYEEQNSVLFSRKSRILKTLANSNTCRCHQWYLRQPAVHCFQRRMYVATYFLWLRWPSIPVRNDSHNHYIGQRIFKFNKVLPLSRTDTVGCVDLQA